MAKDDADEQSFFDFLVDDPEQTMSGTPTSPQFNPDVLEPAPHHATAAADRPIVPRPAPPRQIPRQIPRLGPATPPIAAETSPGLGVAARNFACSLPSHQQQQHGRNPIVGSYPTRPAYSQQSFIQPPNVDWQPPRNSPLGGTDTPTSSSSNLFEYSGRAANQGDSGYSEYIPPLSIHNNTQTAAFGFGLPWSGGGGTDRSPAMPNTVPPESLPSSTSPWQDDDDGLEGEGPSSVPEELGMDDTSRSSASYQNKRQKKATSPSATTHSQKSRASHGSKASTLLTSPASASPASSRPSKLRSASRTSKNTHHKPAETPEEQRTRASHNLVEKQYRNRLNAQFESLLNALPEQVRSGGDGDESDALLDFTDKRVSKAEVLDMARRHIRALERERDALERERNELLASMERLRDVYNRGGPPPGGAGDTAAGGVGPPGL